TLENDMANTHTTPVPDGRAGVESMTIEEDRAMARLHRRWHRFYQPQGPGSEHVVDICYRAKVLSDRTTRTHENCLPAQLEETDEQWQKSRDALVEQTAAERVADPAGSHAVLRRFGHGLRWLIHQIMSYTSILSCQGCWSEEACRDVIRLL